MCLFNLPYSVLLLTPRIRGVAHWLLLEEWSHNLFFTEMLETQ